MQPHSQACRERIEKELGTDIRIKNAKVRLQERVKRKTEEEEEGEKTTEEGDKVEADVKKRRLDELEDQAMREENPEKLSELFEEYRREYIKVRESNEEETKRRRTGTET